MADLQHIFSLRVQNNPGRRQCNRSSRFRDSAQAFSRAGSWISTVIGEIDWLWHRPARSQQQHLDAPESGTLPLLAETLIRSSDFAI
eukprot:3934159-Rhodomonas_salina.7